MPTYETTLTTAASSTPITYNNNTTGAGGASGTGGLTGWYLGSGYTNIPSVTDSTYQPLNELHSIKESIDKINKRLSILVPDPAKLEKYESLKAAYEQYLILEALIGEDNMSADTDTK